MTKNKRKEWSGWIEIPGYLFTLTLFLSIWISEYRWRLFFTSLFFILIAVANVIAKQEREKKKK